MFYITLFTFYVRLNQGKPNLQHHRELGRTGSALAQGGQHVLKVVRIVQHLLAPGNLGMGLAERSGQSMSLAHQDVRVRLRPSPDPGDSTAQCADGCRAHGH